MREGGGGGGGDTVERWTSKNNKEQPRRRRLQVCPPEPRLQAALRAAGRSVTARRSLGGAASKLTWLTGVGGGG